MLCPKCQTENPEGAKFCNSCGAPLSKAKVETFAAEPAQGAPETAPTPEEKPRSRTCLYIAIGVIVLLLLAGGVGFLFLRRFIKETGILEEIKRLQGLAPTTETTTKPTEKPSPFGKIEEEEPTPTPTEKEEEPIKTVDVHFPPGPDIREVAFSKNRYSEEGDFTASLLGVKNTPGALHVRYRIECKRTDYDWMKCQVPSFDYGEGWANEYNPAIGGYALDEDTGEKHLVQTRTAEGAIKGSQIASGVRIKVGESKSMWIEFEPLPQTTKTVTIKLGYIDAFDLVPVEQY